MIYGPTALVRGRRGCGHPAHPGDRRAARRRRRDGRARGIRPRRRRALRQHPRGLGGRPHRRAVHDGGSRACCVSSAPSPARSCDHPPADRGIRLHHGFLRRGVRPRPSLLHDDARAAAFPGAGAVAARRHLPARYVRRPVHRRGPARPVQRRARGMWFFGGCLVATILLVLLGPDPRGARPCEHAAVRHGSDPAAGGRVRDDVAAPRGAVARRPRCRVAVGRAFGATGRAAAVGCVDRARRGARSRS